MNVSDSSELYLTHIAVYLMAKREIIFNGWRSRVNADLSLHTATHLTRAEFNDQVPMVLNILDKRLRQEVQTDDLASIASQHGSHRWQKGYKLSELLGELDHLHATLDHELDNYQSTQPELNLAVLFQAYRTVRILIHEAIKASATQYNNFQRQEAAQRADDLKQALESLNKLTDQRNTVLRQVSHDLNAYFSLITAAGGLLDQPNSDEEEATFRQMWQRNLTNTVTLLTELMDLSRLEAGQEVLQISEFDGSTLLIDLAKRIKPVAQQEQIDFQWTGPDSLPVEGDSIKIQRIVQNLLINALHHTKSGWVTLSWSQEDTFRWIISVQDSGPGLSQEIIARLGRNLAPTIESTGVLHQSPLDQSATLQEPAIRTRSKTKGEGIGLLIVKQLCEMLGASLDIETEPGVGTIFRTIIPRQYTKRL